MTVYRSFPHWRGSTVAMHWTFTGVYGRTRMSPEGPRGVVLRKKLAIVTCVC